MADDDKVYTFASAFPVDRKNPHPDSPTPVSEKELAWTESDKTKHTGTEYRFDPASGLPPLRLEWSAQQVGWGVGVLFMATTTIKTGGGPSDYQFEAEGDQPGGDEHPDNEQHFRTTLYEQYALLFPDKAEASYDPATLKLVDPGAEGASTVTVADVVDEAIRRYRQDLVDSHPDPTVQNLQTIEQLRAEIELSVEMHNLLAVDVATADPDQAPATLVLDVGPVAVAPDATPVEAAPVDPVIVPLAEG